MNTPLKILLAALSGGLLVLCFPWVGLAWASPFAFIPILAICYSAKPRGAFFYGWFTGIIFFAGLCYWVGIYGVIPLLVMAVGIGVCFAVSFAWISAAAIRFPWWARMWLVPAIWTAVEVLRSESGVYSFPYGVIGYAFHGFGPALGLASAIGVYGVSFFVVAASAGALETGLALRKKRPRRAAATAVICFVAVILAMGAGLGLNRGLSVDSGSTAKVALVQAAIPQDQKWLSSKSDEIMNKYESLVAVAGRAQPDLIVLPEAALPAYVKQEDALVARLRSWAVKAHKPLLAGVPLLKAGGAYNTAVLFDERGRQTGTYAKITPVLFGETIPFRRLSEMIYPDFEQMGDIKTGSEQTVFRIKKDSGFSFGVLICSESMYSRLAIRLARANPDAIVVITNDGWFYSSNEAALHFGMTKYRAAETGRYIAQAANTGISAVISPSGSVKGEIGLNKTGVSTGLIRARRGGTVFTAGGWIFLCLIIVISAGAVPLFEMVKICTNAQDASIILNMRFTRRFIAHITRVG